MNVCLFADSFLPKVGGMEVAIHHLANSLHDIGCGVTVIAKNNNFFGHFEYKYRLVRYGNTFPGSGRLGADFASGCLTLIREHKKRRFDVINCHGVAYAGSRAAFAKYFLDAPLLMTPHGQDIQRIPEIGYGYRMSKRWDRRIKRNLSHADAVTAISDSVKNELKFVPESKVFVIPNGIDTKRFVSRKSNYLHNLLSLDSKIRIVLSVGRNDITKGYEYGLQAFKALDEMGACRDLVYVIVGKGTNTLEPLVRKMSLSDKIFLLPQKEPKAIVECYQSAWCFFSPSITEGLSLVSIEAMATGLPLVVTDVPGNLDIVRDNECGLIVRSKDPDSMAKGLLSLVENQNLYSHFSKEALEKVKGYDWHDIARRYLKVYRLTIKRST